MTGERAGGHLFNGNGDVLHGMQQLQRIKLMSHTMKLWERIIYARLREIASISENEFEFRPHK